MNADTIIKNHHSERHGGCYDRGAADSYYSRPIRPHYYKGGTGTSEKVTAVDMTTDEVAAYIAGYDFNEQHGDKKNWE